MSRQATRRVSGLLVLCMSVVLASPAVAGRRARTNAEEHYQRGMKAYTLGKFEEAIEEFERAYEMRSEPIFLYNIAQSHRQNNNPQRAAFFYRRYLEAEPDAKNRADIEQRIADMEAQVEAKTESATTPPAVSQPVVMAPMPPPQPVVVQPVVTDETPPASDPSTGRGLRIAGISAGALGVAGVVTGIILGVHANSLHEESTKAGSYFDSSKYESSKTYRNLEWVFLGVGAAAMVTGGVLYYLGVRRSRSASIAFAPIASPGTGGAALCATF